MTDLFNFLCEAKKNTFAKGLDCNRVEESVDGSLDYEYQLGNYKYHATMFGTTRFTGQEVVYKDGFVIWAVSYYGFLLDEKMDPEEFKKILREALMKVGDLLFMPVRGPKKCKIGDYKYTCEITGGLEFFAGTESIFKDDKRIYVLRLNGGRIDYD